MKDNDAYAQSAGFSSYAAMEAYLRSQEEAAESEFSEDVVTSLKSAKQSKLNLLRFRNKAGELLGPVQPVEYNATAILSHDPKWSGVLALNEFDGNVVKVKSPPSEAICPTGVDSRGPWTDSDTSKCRSWMQKEYGVNFSRNDLEAAIQTVAESRRFHPVKRKLEALKHDGKSRCVNWLSEYLGVRDSAYTRSIGPKILISLIARIFQPGCKLDTMPVLEGSQGLRKSSVWRTLALEDDWFSDTPSAMVGDKDSYQSLRGVWIVEYAELMGILKGRGRNVEATKAFLASGVDRYRPSYGRRSQTFPRQCVFVGTTNETDYLLDMTGNRRFWPIACGEIRLEDLKRDRDQLLAEAVVLFKSGHTWWLSEEEEQSATLEQEQRLEEDPWETEVALQCAGENGITVASVLSLVKKDIQQHTNADHRRVAGIMRKLGYKPRGSSRPRLWYRDGVKEVVRNKEKTLVAN